MPQRDLSWHDTQARVLDAHALRRSANGRLKRGDYRGAAIYLDALLKHDPQPETALQLAQMHNRCRAYTDCLTILRQARRQWPDDMALLRVFAETAMFAKAFADAAAAWQDLITRHGPETPYPILRALACLRATGQHASAQHIMAVHGDSLRTHMARAALQMLRRSRLAESDIPRGLYLVSGNNGTGKSTLGHFLHAMGFAIIDADIEIASFCHNRFYSDLRYDLMRATGAPATDLQWAWPEMRVTQCFATARKRKEPVFVIGGQGATVAPYVPRFRGILQLTAPDDVIAQRLAKRNSVSHKVGSKGYAAALKRNARTQNPDYPATLIAADRPVWAICADVLSSIRADCPAPTAYSLS